MIRSTFALLGLALASPAFADVAPAAPALDAKALFSRSCSGCHGGDGKGDTKVGHKYQIADLTDPKWAASWDRAKVRNVVEDGVSGQMPAWKMKLSADEIDAVTGYVFVLAGAPKHK